MNAPDDDVYCHEVARRAVARAALHLGIECMSQEALDVLGCVLVTHLGKVGKVLSSMVESSGRTSAHVNVLDALEAIAMCASPAVHKLNLAADEESLTEASPNQVSADSSSAAWHDLAQFLLGPDWMRNKRDAAAAEDQVPLGTGKVGPSGSSSSSNVGEVIRRVGWEAPYLDEIPSFPCASNKCANPHTLPENVSGALHQYKTTGSSTTDATTENDPALQNMPDRVFQVEWGSVVETTGVDDSAAINPPAALKDGDLFHSERPKKRVKLAESKAAATTYQPLDETRPSYVPSFLPPFPSFTSLGRAVVEVDSKTTTTSLGMTEVTSTNNAKATSDKEALDVRSSLVKLGQYSYWGSGWDAKAGLKVPLGRRGDAPASGVVVPVSRPSGSRVGRILEGSMEPTA